MAKRIDGKARGIKDRGPMFSKAPVVFSDGRDIRTKGGAYTDKDFYEDEYHTDLDEVLADGPADRSEPDAGLLARLQANGITLSDEDSR